MSGTVQALEDFFFFFCHTGTWDLKFTQQGSNPRPLQWKFGVLTTRLPGKSPGFGGCWSEGDLISVLR